MAKRTPEEIKAQREAFLAARAAKAAKKTAIPQPSLSKADATAPAPATKKPDLHLNLSPKNKQHLLRHQLI